jgi:hypothetical protein
MMERFTVRKNIKRTPTTYKLTVKPKKLLLTLDSHMLQLSFKLTKWVAHQSQVLHLFLTQVFHTLKELHTTQVPHQWIQMPPCGKEVLYMMARFMVRNNTKKMLTTFKHTVKLKRLLPIQEFHMHQH